MKQKQALNPLDPLQTKPQKQPSPALKDLGQVIQAKRKQKGISQGNLSLKAGLQYHYVGVIERGKRNATYLILRRIAKALDLTVSELLEGVDMESGG